MLLHNLVFKKNILSKLNWKYFTISFLLLFWSESEIVIEALIK